MVTVTIGGYSPEGVVAVEESNSRGSEVGAATVRMQLTPTNRDTIASGDDVTIDRGGTTVFSGYVVGKEADPDDGRLAVRCHRSTTELLEERVNRAVYEQESAAAVREALTQRAEALGTTPIHVGSDTADWTSTAPVFQLYGGPVAGLYRSGTDMLVVAARRGRTDPFAATYEAVPGDALADGFFEIRTRVLASNPGDILDFAVELTDGNGTSYVWSPTLPDGGDTLRLKAEEATPDDGRLDAPNTLQYRFAPRSAVQQPVAVAIDDAYTLPYRLRDRPTGLSTDVVPTGRTITRRVDQSAAAFVEEMALEDGVEWWVDNTDTVHFGGGGRERPYSITKSGSTPVIEADFDRDFSDIVNEVTVQGRNGVEVTERDRASIDFYGITPRQEPIVDDDITREADARARAQGYLDDNAWSDLVATFVVGDESFSALTPGDRIRVEWPPADLSGRFYVDEVATDDYGRVTVAVSGSSGIGG
jgi:hypothetical protein